MNKLLAFSISLIITIIILILFLYSANEKVERREVFVSRVIDGDTLEISSGERLRLANINSPEKNSELSILSKSYLKYYENKSIEIEVLGTDKYGRILAKAYSPEYLNLELVKLGLSSKFLVNSEELEEFNKAEQYAINNSLGMWEKSVYYGCFRSKIDPKKEIVYLENYCKEINLSSWTIKDESRKIYRFKLNKINRINLHSSFGEDNASDIYWNSKTHIWNDDRDTLYLFDEKLHIAYSYSYGY